MKTQQIATQEELNNMSNELLKYNKIYKDFRNEKENTRHTIVEISTFKDYALIEKKDGNTVRIRHFQNVLAALLKLP